MHTLTLLDFQRVVMRRARQFDLKPLLELLARYGYGRDAIRFRSVANGSADTFIERVDFAPYHHEVVITVAMGLLGDSALLPSYYLREAEKSGRRDAFEDFVGFFDHWLIRNYVAAVWPEDDAIVYENYPRIRAALLGITGFSSLSTMEWLIGLLFPDVKHVVRRAAFPVKVRGQGIRTGAATLDGTGVLGDEYAVEVDGYAVVLTVDEEFDLRDNAWSTVLKHRVVDRLVPLLEPFAIPLSVVLQFSSFDNELRLPTGKWVDRKYPEPGALGYPVLGGKRAPDRPLSLWWDDGNRYLDGEAG